VRHFTVLCGPLLRKQNRRPPSGHQWIKWVLIRAINPTWKAEQYNYLRVLMHTYGRCPCLLHSDITPLTIGNHPGRATQRNPAGHPSTSIVFHYLRDSQRSHDGAIASHATDCSFGLAAADPARVDSHVAPGTAMMRRAAARAHETGLRKKTRGSPGMHPRGPSCRASRHLS